MEMVHSLALIIYLLGVLTKMDLQFQWRIPTYKRNTNTSNVLQKQYDSNT